MIRRRLILLFGLLMALVVGVEPVCAQQAEPPANTGGTVVGFAEGPFGDALTDSLPALRPDLDMVELLGSTPGSFVYQFARPGWPDGWSPFGLSPNFRPLSFNGAPFDHIFTGQPAFNLLPFTLLDRPRRTAATFARPTGVSVWQRSFVSDQPITEGTYWRGGDGLQSIDAVHAQHRRLALFDRPGFLNVMAAYSGRASNVSYPGSDLRRARRVQVRLRYEQPDWSVEMLNLHNRRTIGAHAGVVPQGTLESIYQAGLAEVENPDANRRTVRNDLQLSLRAHLLSSVPTDATALWTEESFRYRDPEDTLVTASRRLGVLVGQPLLTRTAHRLSIHVQTWVDRVEPQGGFDRAVQRQTHLHIFGRDSIRIAGINASMEGGWVRSGSSAGVSGAASVSFSNGPLRLDAEISSSVAPRPIALSTGFGTVSGLVDASGSRVTTARTAASLQRGDVRVEVGLFGYHDAKAIDLYAEGDSVAVRRATTASRHAGAYADVSWRRSSERGFYAVFRPTYSRFLDATRSALHERVASALPAWYGSMRVGARYALFQGDLDFDIYVEEVAWAGMSGRLLHPQTGLLIVPEAGADDVSASNELNLVAEVRIRDAKLFLALDNVLAGTSLLAGNFIVPIYPLPAQRFRFGVHWPIFG